MKIAVAGTGYVGLSNALLLSQHNDVWAVDILQSKIDLINKGKSPIVEQRNRRISGKRGSAPDSNNRCRKSL